MPAIAVPCWLPACLRRGVQVRKKKKWRAYFFVEDEQKKIVPLG